MIPGYRGRDTTNEPPAPLPVDYAGEVVYARAMRLPRVLLIALSMLWAASLVVTAGWLYPPPLGVPDDRPTPLHVLVLMGQYALGPVLVATYRWCDRRARGLRAR